MDGSCQLACDALVLIDFVDPGTQELGLFFCLTNPLSARPCLTRSGSTPGHTNQQRHVDFGLLLPKKNEKYKNQTRQR